MSKNQFPHKPKHEMKTQMPIFLLLLSNHRNPIIWKSMNHRETQMEKWNYKKDTLLKLAPEFVRADNRIALVAESEEARYIFVHINSE